MSIKENIVSIKKNIEDIEKKCNRQDKVNLMAVTKTVDVDKVLEAIDAGITDIGENKPQELARKYEAIGDKVKYIIDKAYMIHSLDRIALCEEIQKRAEKIDKVINCLVQVNISKEESKHGLEEEEVIDFIKEVSSNYKNIHIKGLMTMAPFIDDEQKIRQVFKDLKDLSLEVKKLNLSNVDMDTLSMGMSHDYKIAIEEGSTIVRVGTSIFGERNYNK